MVLTDDNYASIVSAIEEGRVIYSNIRKFVYYLISCNIGEILIIFLAMLFGWPLPLRPVQLLMLILVTDGAPALALGMEKGDPDIMKLPPRPRKERLMSNATLRRVVFIGAIESIFAMGGFLYVLLSHGWSWGDASWMNPASPHYAIYKEALMMTQAAIVAGQFANGFACRTERESVFKVGLLTNRFLLVGQAVAIAIICIISYVPFAQNIFKTGPLTLADWGFLVVTAVVLFFAEELRKWFLRRKTAPQGG